MIQLVKCLEAERDGMGYCSASTEEAERGRSLGRAVCLTSLGLHACTTTRGFYMRTLGNKLRSSYK